VSIATETQSAQVGQPVLGPSALGGDLRRFVYLTVTLAVTDFKMRFFGSALGYFWQLMRPLMLFGVLYLVFTEFVRVGKAVPHYPVILLTNIILYTFFAEATSGAVTAMVSRENLVRKIQFPRLVIPCAVVLTATFSLVLNLCVVLSFALASGVKPNWGWLQFPLLVGALGIFTLGCATLISALYVRFRDLKPIWEVTLQLLFYATPVLYTIESINHRLPSVAHALLLNPLAAILQQVRHAVIDPNALSAGAAMGASWRLLFPLFVIGGALLLSLYVFKREAPRIAEEL
jgi:ABC-2 type transport system permease protein